MKFSKAQLTDDWVNWKGGRQPVEDEHLVEVELWGGTTRFKCYANHIEWDYNRPKGDWIVRFRIIN